MQAYVGWIIRHIRYHGMRHPSEPGEAGVIATLRELPGHAQVSRTMIFTRVLNRGGWGCGAPRTGWVACSGYCGDSCGLGRGLGRIRCR